MRMEIKFLAVLMFAVVLPVLGAIPESDFHGKEDIEKALQAASQTQKPAERIETISRYFLGRPFAWGPLGEGAGSDYDVDPISRTDKFDCTTYVETVLAAAVSSDWESFKKNLLRIRYRQGQVNYFDRNHFIETDWLPNNIKSENLLEEITLDVIGIENDVASTTIKKASWYRKMEAKSINHPGLTPDELKGLLATLHARTDADVPARMDYIRFFKVFTITEDDYLLRVQDETRIREENKNDKDKLKAVLTQYRADWLKAHADKINEKMLRKIPSGTLVNFVHKERPLEQAIGTNMLVTHQAFLFWKDGVLYQRHAALNKEVLDVPFVEYVNQFLIGSTMDPWGFHLVRAK